MNKRDVPRRFYKIFDGRTYFGAYFPGTDLIIWQDGRRGTGRPKDVFWLDEVDPEGHFKMVEFLEELSLQWNHCHSEGIKTEQITVGQPYHMLVVDFGTEYELIEKGFFVRVPKQTVKLSEPGRGGWAPEGYKRPEERPC